ncbi:MAG: hypothetical protein ACOYOU_03950 [Kiritimatiellia bacterium]
MNILERNVLAEELSLAVGRPRMPGTVIRIAMLAATGLTLWSFPEAWGILTTKFNKYGSFGYFQRPIT